MVLGSRQQRVQLVGKLYVRNIYLDNIHKNHAMTRNRIGISQLVEKQVRFGAKHSYCKKGSQPNNQRNSNNAANGELQMNNAASRGVFVSVIPILGMYSQPGDSVDTNAGLTPFFLLSSGIPFNCRKLSLFAGRFFLYPGAGLNDCILFEIMGIHVYSPCNDIKERYIVQRPNIAGVPAAEYQTAQTHETEWTRTRGSGFNPVSPDSMERSVEGGQNTLSLRTKSQELMSRALERLFGEREKDAQEDNDTSQILFGAPSQLFHSCTSSKAEGRENIRTSTVQDTRRDPVTTYSFFTSLRLDPDRPQDCCALPPPYTRNSSGPPLPSYDVVIEEEWRRVRSLRRRTLGEGDTATHWCKPILPHDEEVRDEGNGACWKQVNFER